MKNSIKIAVLCLNPSIDRQISCERISLGELNRVDMGKSHFGGKGINVSVMLSRLSGGDGSHGGGEAEVSCFCPVSEGESGALREFLEREGVTPRLFEVDYPIRQNLKIIEGDGRETEINERGGVLRGDILARIKDELFLGDFDVLCLCGSFPQAVENSVYNSIIARANEKKIATFLDCDGEALSLGFKAYPTMIKPNFSELLRLEKSLFGEENKTNLEGKSRRETAEIICSKLMHKCDGRTAIFTTLGDEGALYVGGDEVIFTPVESVKARGFSGAGDTALAAFIYSITIKNIPTATALAFAMSAARAKVMKAGTELPTVEEIEKALT